MSSQDQWPVGPVSENVGQGLGDPGCSAGVLKSALLQLAEQVAAADRRQSAALQDMHQKLAKLGGQTEAVKAALPMHLVAAFERIEAGMASLAEQLSATDQTREASSPAASMQEALALTPMNEPVSAHHFDTGAALPVSEIMTAEPEQPAEDDIGHDAPASPQLSAPPPLKSAIGLQPPGTWGSRDMLKPVEPIYTQNPDDPWDSQSAAELTRLYESGEAGIPPLKSAFDDRPVLAVAPPAVEAPLGSRVDQMRTDTPTNAEVAPLPLATLAAATMDQQQHAWLDSRLDEMAARIERSLMELRPESSIAALGERFDSFEAKFTSALDSVATRSDVEGLRLIEAHISELSSQIEETRGQLGRLDSIERQLMDLQASLGDEEILRKLGGIVPTEEDLVRYAEEAATRVASRVVQDTPRQIEPDQHAMRMFADVAQASQSAHAEASRQLRAMQEVFATYMDERRRGEAQTADALDTMQHAMQHMLDRVDAIEMRGDFPPEGQPAAYDEFEPAPKAAPAPVMPPPPTTPEALQRTFAEEAKAAAARMAAQIQPTGRPAARPAMSEEPTAIVHEPPVPGDELPTRIVGANPAARAEEPIVVPASGQDQPAQGKPQDRQAFIAMARRAAEQAKQEADRLAAASGKPSAEAPPAGKAKNGKASLGGKPGSRPGILVAASLGAFLLAGGLWVMSSPKFRLFNSGITFGRPAAPQAPAAPVEPAAKSPANPRGPAIDEEATPRQPEPRETAPQSEPPKPRRSVPETGIDDLGQLPKGGEKKADVRPPAGPPPVQNVGLGIALEHGPTQLTPEDVIRARQKAHVANLSQRTAQDAARIAAVPQDQLPDGIVEVVKGEAPAAPAQPAERATVELPPAAVGPMSLRLAAAKGDPSAQFDVAARYAEGRGVPQDFGQAAHWYQRAAQQGLAQAQYRLAGLLERGLGVKADPARARIWYKRAAEQGNLKAMHNLAVLNAGSEATPAELAAAHKWFGEAAERGLSDSQFNLAVLLESGLGVEKDPVQAYKWYALAARTGDKEAVRRRDLIKAKLDPEQRTVAEAAVAGWRQRAVDHIANDPRAAGEAWKRAVSNQ